MKWQVAAGVSYVLTALIIIPIYCRVLFLDVFEMAHSFQEYSLAAAAYISIVLFAALPWLGPFVSSRYAFASDYHRTGFLLSLIPIGYVIVIEHVMAYFDITF